jgi:tRNA(Ile)-lysidine synthase
LAGRGKLSAIEKGRAFDPAHATSAIDPRDVFGAIDFSGREKVIVAVSGGGDSLALLVLLDQYLGTTGSRVRPVAVTVDHRLRRESADETRQVAAIAHGMGIEHRTLAWEGTKPASGISAAAREVRHRLLARAARDAGADLVLTGHTMDDQAETVAMRSQRGEGRGAAGISPATLFERDCWFARPLLATRRKALREYLTSRGQHWIDDPSNEDRRFERVRARAALSDAEVERLAAQAARAAAQREALGVRAAALIETHASTPAPGVLRFAPSFAASADHEAAVYALRILLAAAGGLEQLPDEERSAALLDRLAGGTVRATLGRCLIERRRDETRISRERRGKEGGGEPAIAPAPTLGPWARYLPSFDLAPAQALARLIGLGEIPPSPWAKHNRPKA